MAELLNIKLEMTRLLKQIGPKPSLFWSMNTRTVFALVRLVLSINQADVNASISASFNNAFDLENTIGNAQCVIQHGLNYEASDGTATGAVAFSEKGFRADNSPITGDSRGAQILGGQTQRQYEQHIETLSYEEVSVNPIFSFPSILLEEIRENMAGRIAPDLYSGTVHGLTSQLTLRQLSHAVSTTSDISDPVSLHGFQQDGRSMLRLWQEDHLVIF